GGLCGGDGSAARERGAELRGPPGGAGVPGADPGFLHDVLLSRADHVRSARLSVGGFAGGRDGARARERRGGRDAREAGRDGVTPPAAPRAPLPAVFSFARGGRFRGRAGRKFAAGSSATASFHPPLSRRADARGTRSTEDMPRY